MSELDNNKIELTSNKNTSTANNAFNGLKGIVEQIETIILTFAIISLFLIFIGRFNIINGPSMENTLHNKETVFVSNLFYKPQRNDIIVFHETENLKEALVKRVIGLPGETVNIRYVDDNGSKKMEVTIIDSSGNKTQLDEKYTKFDLEYYSDYRYKDFSTYVEDGTVFVLGDNRTNSTDSRSNLVGLVDQRSILGKVIFRIMPFSKFGKVN